MNPQSYSREQLASMRIGQEIAGLIGNQPRVIENILSLYRRNLDIPLGISFEDYELYQNSVWSYERIAEELIPDICAISFDVARAVIGKVVRSFISPEERKKVAAIVKRMTAFQVAFNYNPAFSVMDSSEVYDCGRRGRESMGMTDYTPEQRQFILDWQYSHQRKYRGLIELTDAFNDKFGTTKSKSAVDSLRRRLC